jgi:hypothetical protein
MSTLARSILVPDLDDLRSLREEVSPSLEIDHLATPLEGDALIVNALSHVLAEDPLRRARLVVGSVLWRFFVATDPEPSTAQIEFFRHHVEEEQAYEAALQRRLAELRDMPVGPPRVIRVDGRPITQPSRQPAAQPPIRRSTATRRKATDLTQPLAIK